MKVEIVNPPFMVKPVGYAHCARVALPGGGHVVLTGGIVGMDQEGRVLHPDDIARQFDVALGNVVAVLRHAGASPEQVARMRIYCTDIPAYQARARELGQAWRKHFGRHYPAMALLGVRQLYDRGALLEIEAEAYTP